MKIQVRDTNNEELTQAIQAIGQKDALIDRLIAERDRLIAERDRLDAENERLNSRLDAGTVADIYLELRQRIVKADEIIAGQVAEIDEQEKAMRAMRIEVAQTRRQLERVIKVARGEE